MTQKGLDCECLSVGQSKSVLPVDMKGSKLLLKSNKLLIHGHLLRHFITVRRIQEHLKIREFERATPTCS